MSLGKQMMRSTKNLVKGYSDVQVKVRDATSNDPWGPSGALMQEIADSTYNHKDFMEVMEIIDKRLNDSGKNWRHVFKALILLDYLLHAGSEAIMSYAKENFYVIKTLKEFQYVDEEGKDQGANVRQKSKEITMLLADEARLKEERRTRKDMISRMGPTDEWGYGADTYGSSSSRSRDADLPPTPPPVARPSNNNNDDAELQRALEESRRTAMEDERKRAMMSRAVSESEDDLAKAIRLSEAEARAKEEERRRQMAAARRQPEPDLFDFNTPTIQQNNPMYLRSDSMPSMGYGQQGYYGQGFGNDFGSMNTGYQQYGDANPFGAGQGADSSFNNPFGAAFDGGSGARPLPHQIAGGTPNAQIASIARNAIQIDPFANLASSRAPSIAAVSPTGYDDFGGSASNPFGAPVAPAAPQDDFVTRPAPTRTATGAMAAKPASRFVPTMNVASTTSTPQNYGSTVSASTAPSDFGGLVNLSSSALASAPKPVSNNPFGAPSTDPWSQPQPTLNDLGRANTTQAGQGWGAQPSYPYGSQQQGYQQQGYQQQGYQQQPYQNNDFF